MLLVDDGEAALVVPELGDRSLVVAGEGVSVDQLDAGRSGQAS